MTSLILHYFTHFLDYDTQNVLHNVSLKNKTSTVSPAYLTYGEVTVLRCFQIVFKTWCEVRRSGIANEGKTTVQRVEMQGTHPSLFQWYAPPYSFRLLYCQNKGYRFNFQLDSAQFLRHNDSSALGIKDLCPLSS